MTDRPSADRTAELLFWYARQPSRYQAEGRRREAPRLDPEVVLKLALRRAVKFADASWNERAKVDALGLASRAYIRHLFFRPDPTPYQVLGLEPGASPEQIKECFRLLMQLVHPDRQGENRRWPDACAAQANWVYSMLRDQETRRSFEEEAQARDALARAINRAAMAAEASQMPMVIWPKKPAKGKRGVPGQMLPEWLTAGVGGYVRQHPATAAFGALVAIAVAVIGASMWEGRDGSLVRISRDEPTTPKSMAATPIPAAEASAAAPVPAPEPAPSRSARSAAPEPPIVLASAAPAMDVGRTSADLKPPLSAETSARAASASRGSHTLAAAVADPAPVRVAEAQAAPKAATNPAESSEAPRVAPVASSTASPPQLVATVEAVPMPQPAALPVALATTTVAAPAPPASAEVEAFLASFVDSYERGRLDAFASLFDEDADTTLRRGRAAIRGEYDELFRLSRWRRMQLTRISWRQMGDRAVAKGEITVRIGWRDGREVEQRVSVDMELVRRDGRVVIARLSHQPKNP